MTRPAAAAPLTEVLMNLVGHSRLISPKKHKYVALIEYALKNPVFSAEDACQAVGLSEKEFRFISSSIFSLNAVQSSQDFRSNQKHDWILLPEAYFSHLQYLEFQHAIEHARRAYWISVLAIIVSIIGVGIALYAPNTSCTRDLAHARQFHKT